MANYNCAVRINYFKVKDEKAFLSLMEKAQGGEDGIQVFTLENKDKEGKTTRLYGFGCYGGISGLLTGDSEYCDYDYEAFLKGLQECVADDDAILIMEVGNENLRFVIGTVDVITSKEISYVNMTEAATKMAAEMLGRPDYTTRCEY